jgi:uncharacterized protein YjbJ (UPF0337 family)
MADSHEAEDIAGRAKEASGDLIGNDDLTAEGTNDSARAQLKDEVDTVANKARDAVDTVTDAASAKADAAADKATEVGHALADTAEDLSQQVSGLTDKAADAAHDLHLDDRRVQQFGAIAATAFIATLVVLAVRRRRHNSPGKVGSIAKSAAATGMGRALNR